MVWTFRRLNFRIYRLEKFGDLEEEKILLINCLLLKVCIYLFEDEKNMGWIKRWVDWVVSYFYNFGEIIIYI